jgi:hypothetical protein
MFLEQLKYFRFKTLSFAIVFISGLLVFFYPIIESIINVLFYELKTSSGNYYLRLETIQFYFDTLFERPITYFLGNGVASQKVRYGLEMLFYKEEYRFYQSDIGLIGDYIRFGIVYLIGIFFILYKIFKNTFSLRVSYLKYFFLMITITMLVLSHFGIQDSIGAICCGLYLIDKKNKISY